MGSLTTSEAAFGGAILGVSLMTICLFAIAYYVLYIVAFWKIFEKAGEKGWKSIIPVYNMYIQFKVTWETKFFWITLALLLVGGCCTGLAGSDSGSVFSLIGSLLTLVGCIFILIDYYYLSKSFGHGAGFFIGLLFLEFIFTLVLGFGSSQYVGNAGKKEV